MIAKADIEVLARAAGLPYDKVRFIVRLTERSVRARRLGKEVLDFAGATSYPENPPTRKSETSARG